jgi:murein DD-endopeptidase MepM/ murein hydrolase activator NlpD
MKRVLLFFFILFFFVPTYSQKAYPQHYFRSPIDFRILLAGTFGELRADHFHTGIDIKTRGVEGAKVYAVADGYVSRVKVSAFGTGKTIYLTHPNGYVSVYGHLSRFNAALAAYVKDQQYKKQSFEVDLYLKKGQFEYAKSDIIAFSGNTGSSGGPHLHFEIRDEKTQEPLNPLLFGIQVKDYIRPIINSIRVYPLRFQAFNLSLSGWGENYHLKQGDSLAVPNAFYLGINTIDKQNDSKNKNGVFEVKLFLDSTQVYGNKQERLNFSTGRYINTFIDYAYYSRFKRRYQRSYISENNRLKVYTEVKHRGLIELKDGQWHELIYEVKDANGNLSRLRFFVQASDQQKFKTLAVDSLKKAVFYPKQSNQFQAENFKFSIPPRAIYDSMNLHFALKPSIPESYSPVFQLNDPSFPLQKAGKLSIYMDSIRPELKPKLVITRIEDKKFIPVSTQWNGDWAVALVRNFGSYTVIADTVKPEIKWLKRGTYTDFKPGVQLRFRVKDKWTGLNSYKATLNGHWVLLEYDAKKDILFYTVDKRYLSKENVFKIEVEDGVGNKNSWQHHFSAVQQSKSNQ